MFWRKNASNVYQTYGLDKKDSLDAMILEATSQGWLSDRNFEMIPEIVNIYNEAADYFIDIIEESDPRMHESLVYHTCRYLFAKGVEGVILWGLASDGKVSVYFNPKHLNGDIDTGLPPNLHKVVINSIPIGESLFRAHQEFVIHHQKSGLKIDIHAEIVKTLQWAARFGIRYALFHKYQILR